MRAVLVTTYDPDIPEYLLTCTLEGYIAENRESLTESEILRLRALRVGEALSVASGGGCFFVVVGVSEDDSYFVKSAEGEVIGIHHGRPEPIFYEPIS